MCSLGLARCSTPYQKAQAFSIWWWKFRILCQVIYEVKFKQERWQSSRCGAFLGSRKLYLRIKSLSLTNDWLKYVTRRGRFVGPSAIKGKNGRRNQEMCWSSNIAQHANLMMMKSLNGIWIRNPEPPRLTLTGIQKKTLNLKHKMKGNYRMLLAYAPWTGPSQCGIIAFASYPLGRTATRRRYHVSSGFFSV